MTPEPTPVDGMATLPRDEKPDEVMVTTESRTDATTSVSAGAAVEPAAATTAAGALEAAGAALAGASGPVTRAAVPPAARTAARRAAATTEAVPRDLERRGAGDPVGAGAAGGAGGAGGVGDQTVVSRGAAVGGVSGAGVRPSSY